MIVLLCIALVQGQPLTCYTIVLLCPSLVQGQPLKCYTMERIKQHLNLDRHKLVAYALLAGCDFTKGVPGVGKATAVKLLQHLSEEEAILDRWVIMSEIYCTLGMGPLACTDLLMGQVWTLFVGLPATTNLLQAHFLCL